MTNRAPQILRRSSAVTLCALASLFLVACGGGGESGADGSRLDSTVPFSEKSSSGESSDNQSTTEPQESEQASSPETDTNEPEQTASDDKETNTDSTADADTDTNNDQVSDSETTNSDSTSDPGNTSTSETDSGSTDDSNDLLDPVDETSDELVSKVDGSVTLEWYRPQYRENGDLIQDGEIGGYEVRYRQVGAQEAESVVLDGEWEVEYQLDGLEEGEYAFSVAAYDTNGLYSEFVSISPLQ